MISSSVESEVGCVLAYDVSYQSVGKFALTPYGGDPLDHGTAKAHFDESLT